MFNKSLQWLIPFIFVVVGCQSNLMQPEVTSTTIHQEPTPIPLEEPVGKNGGMVGGYTFNQPTFLLKSDRLFTIIDWFSNNNQKLLIFSDTPDALTIETMDIETGHRQILVESNHLINAAVWLSNTNQLAYLRQDETTQKINLHLINLNEPTNLVELASDVQPPLVAMQGTNSLLIFNHDMSLLQQVIPNLGIQQTLTLNPPWPIQRGGAFARYQAAWSDQTDWIIYYNQLATYLVNWQTGEINVVNATEFETFTDKFWVSCARWSPTGEKVALILGFGERVPLHSTKLAVLEIETNQLRLVETNFKYVTDFVWLPDNEHIVLEGNLDEADEYSFIELQLADTTTLQTEPLQLLPSQAIQNGYCNGLLWSTETEQIILDYRLASDGVKPGFYVIDTKLNHLFNSK